MATRLGPWLVRSFLVGGVVLGWLGPNVARAVSPFDYLSITPISDGNPVTNDSGWANVEINATAFKNQSLVTVGDYQFTSYYGADQKLIVGRRDLTDPEGTWFFRRTQFTSYNVNDAHNVSTIAIDGDGYLHAAWGMHGGGPLLYSRSNMPVTDGNPFSLAGDTVGNSAMLANQIPLQNDTNSITYPEFWNIPGSGDVMLTFRTGASGDGDYQLVRWDNASDVWTNVHAAQSTNNSGPQPWIDNDSSRFQPPPDVNAYHNGLVYDSTGRLHVTWTWRTGGDSTTGFTDYQSNHNIMYAYSDNGGVDWHHADGTLYQRNGNHDIDENNATPVINLPDGSSLINQASSAIGPDDTLYTATWYAPNADSGNHTRQYMLIEYDGDQWNTHQVGSRDSENNDNRVPENQLGTFRMSRPIVAVDDDDRVFVVFSDWQRGQGVTVAYSESADRDDWQYIDLVTDENLRGWEPRYDLTSWEQDGVLSLFYQPTGQGLSPTTVSILEWDARAYFDALNPLPGDFDLDGDVDGADFVVWQTNFPTAEGGTLATGDADGDGDVDGADFVIWQTNFPSLAGGSSPAAIPEPSGLLLLTMAGILVSVLRRFALFPSQTVTNDR